MKTPPTLEQFIAGAQFCRYSGSLRIFVCFDCCAYTVNEQRRGKLTAQPAAILARIYAEYGVGKPNTFIADLDRHLALLSP